jgi:hypothetical protein
MNEKDLGAMVIPTKHTYQVEMLIEGETDYEPSFDWFWTREEAMSFIEEEFKTKRVLGAGDEQSEEYYTHAELYTNLSYADRDFDHPMDSVIQTATNNPIVETEVIHKS